MKHLQAFRHQAKYLAAIILMDKIVRSTDFSSYTLTIDCESLCPHCSVAFCLGQQIWQALSPEYGSPGVVGSSSHGLASSRFRSCGNDSPDSATHEHRRRALFSGLSIAYTCPALWLGVSKEIMYVVLLASLS